MKKIIKRFKEQCDSNKTSNNRVYIIQAIDMD